MDKSFVGAGVVIVLTILIVGLTFFGLCDAWYHFGYRDGRASVHTVVKPVPTSTLLMNRDATFYDAQESSTLPYLEITASGIVIMHGDVVGQLSVDEVHGIDEALNIAP